MLLHFRNESNILHVKKIKKDKKRRRSFKTLEVLSTIIIQTKNTKISLIIDFTLIRINFLKKLLSFQRAKISFT